MYEYQQRHITEARPVRGAGEFDCLIIVTDSEWEAKNGWTDISHHKTCRCINASAVLKKVYSKSQQETQEQEQGLVPIEGIQKDEKHIKIWIDVSKEIDIVQQQHL